MTFKRFIIYTVAFMILLPALHNALIGVMSAVDLIIGVGVPFASLIVLYAIIYLCAFGAAQRVLNFRMPEIKRLRLFLLLAAGCAISIAVTYFTLKIGFYSILLPPVLYLFALILAYKQRYKIKFKFNRWAVLGVVLYIVATVSINLLSDNKNDAQ